MHRVLGNEAGGGGEESEGGGGNRQWNWQANAHVYQTTLVFLPDTFTGKQRITTRILQRNAPQQEASITSCDLFWGGAKERQKGARGQKMTTSHDVWSL